MQIVCVNVDFAFLCWFFPSHFPHLFFSLCLFAHCHVNLFHQHLASPPYENKMMKGKDRSNGRQIPPNDAGIQSLNHDSLTFCLELMHYVHICAIEQLVTVQGWVGTQEQRPALETRWSWKRDGSLPVTKGNKQKDKKYLTPTRSGAKN